MEILKDFAGKSLIPKESQNLQAHKKNQNYINKNLYLLFSLSCTRIALHSLQYLFWW